MSKRILLVNETSALNSPAAKEALDMALILAAYDHQVSLFFTGVAVLQLVPNQDARQLDSKNLFKTLKLLELYEIDALYVCATSMKNYDIEIEELGISCQLISSSANLVAEQDHILRF